MNNSQEPIRTIIDRSSLGSPAARKLRARTTATDRSRIIRKAIARTARDSGSSTTKSKRT